MKDLLITHNDLDGLSPIVLMSLTGSSFDYKSIELYDLLETFNEIKEDLKNYETVYITDLTVPEEIYDYLISENINVLVFDHHETHLYAKKYPFVTVEININDRQTCATELFFLYLKEKYPSIDKPITHQYVDLVRQLDTYNFDGDMAKELGALKEVYGTKNFIKTITRRLKTKDVFEFTSFEKRFNKIEKEQQIRYMQNKEKKMLKYLINGYKCGVVFAEANKSELGNYLSNKYPELDLIILIDASSRISYRTCKDDVKVNDFASTYGGGGHQKASGSKFDDDVREKIISDYFKDVKLLDE